MEYEPMLYSMKPTETTAAVPRAVDAHSLPHCKLSKAARACLAADILDGRLSLQGLTIKLVAVAAGVSVGYVNAALRVSPDQRELVRHGRRPLVLPRRPVASLSPQKRFADLVKEIGITQALNLLIESEKKIAA
jgi:hypothetical protein